MEVNVKVPAYLRPYTDDREEIKIQGKTVKDILESLIKQYPGIKARLFDDTGTMHNYVSVFTGDEVAYPDTLETPVKDGATVHILYTIGGG